MITLEKKQISGKYGKFWSYIVSGDTLAIKDKLVNLGFRWYGPDKSWWISDKKFSNYTRQALANIGIVEKGQQPQQTQSTQQNQPEAPKAPIPPTTDTKQQVEQAQQTQKETKTWKTEDEEMSNWYGFPINNNILSYEDQMVVDDKPYKIEIIVDRSYQEGKLSDTYRKTKSREHKGLPKYLIHIKVPELNLNYTYKQLSKSKWGTYNEEEFLKEFQKTLKQNIFEKVGSKLYRNIQHFADINKRTPEYKQFLKEIGDRKLAPEFDFQINDVTYGGNYRIAIDDLGAGEDAADVYLKPSVNAPNAPRRSFIHVKPDLMGTYTIDDFNNRVKQTLQDKHNEIQESYIEYLKSFPFLESQQQEARQDFDNIKGYVLKGGGDADSILRKLQEKEYIRPHKRQKQFGPGLTGGEEIRWVVDSKKIVNDAYSSGYMSKTPDYFYAVIAYYIHRKIRGISSWTDMMLVDSMRTWMDTMNNMGANFNLKEVEMTIEQIGNKIINKVFGSSGYQGGQESQGINVGISGALMEFANFAKEYGIPSENVEENAKSIYRNLAQMIHPDKYLDPVKKQEMTVKFQELQNIWSRMPDQYKKANNWYEKYIMSEVYRSFRKFSKDMIK